MGLELSLMIGYTLSSVLTDSDKFITGGQLSWALVFLSVHCRAFLNYGYTSIFFYLHGD